METIKVKGIEYKVVEPENINGLQWEVTVYDDMGGNEYDLIWYNGELVAMPVVEEAVSTEDYLEWAAASCGMTYNAYIGRPWED